MSDNIMLMIGDDGKATLYDDTYDITIHCESKEEHDEAMRLLKNVPPERKKGKWIIYEVANDPEEHPIAWECDECGAVVDCKTRFCPECGQPKEV